MEPMGVTYFGLLGARHAWARPTPYSPNVQKHFQDAIVRLKGSGSGV